MRNHGHTSGGGNTLALLGVMAIIAAGFFLVLKIGFILHHDPQPAPIASKEWTAIAILILFGGAIAATPRILRSGKRAAEKARIHRDMAAAMATQGEARRHRVAELAADPSHAQYAPLVERGENWSDAQIAYDQNLDRTATCPHLQAIERAIRAAGIPTRISSYKQDDVEAKCLIDFAALRRISPCAPPVRYAEFYQAERDDRDFPTAFLICDEHKCLIHTLHPNEAGAQQAPRFPT